MITETQTPLSTAIQSLRTELADADAGIRLADEEIRRLTGAPAGREEVLEAVGGMIEAMVREARRPLGDALLALSRNSGLLHQHGHIGAVANGLADRLQTGRNLDLSALKPLLAGIAGAEALKAAVLEAADFVEWPNALSAADRVRQIAAANRRRDALLARSDELRRQAAESGVEI